MDQNTIASEISSFCKIPSNPNEWFHVDFQMAYDPCTCLYDSRLELRFRPINSLDIKIENPEFQSCNLDLLDAEGLNQTSAIIPVSPRMITFHTLTENLEYSRMLNEKYIERFANEGYDNSWYSFLHSIFALLESAAYSGSSFISGTDINSAAQHAAEMRLQWELIDSNEMPDFVDSFITDVNECWPLLPANCWNYDQFLNQYNLDLSQLMNFIQRNLPSSQSFGSAGLIVKNEESKFSITPSAAFSGSSVIQNWASADDDFTANLLNPGTYPIQENDNTFTGPTAQNYPVYNEILGLFAVLEQPKLDIFHDFEVTEGLPWVNQTSTGTTCANNTIQGPFVTERFTSSVAHDRYKFKLSEPLKIVFNPAVNIDFNALKISASLTLMGSMTDIAPQEGRPYGEQGLEIPTNPPCEYDQTYFWIYPVVEEFNYSTNVSNLRLNELSTQPFPDVQNFAYTSPVVPLDQFNTMVCEISSSSSQKWQDIPRAFVSSENPVNCWWETPPGGFYCGAYPQETLNQVIDEFQEIVYRKIGFLDTQNGIYEGINHYGYIDLMLEIPILSENENQVIVYQKTRLPLGENQNFTTTEFSSDWSYTDNPNEIGSNPLADFSLYETKHWTIQEMSLAGGEYLSPPSNNPVIKPSALHYIEIFGNQTKDNNISEVIFQAEDHINVHGNVVLPIGFTLRLNDLVNETALATPAVTSTELAAFCAGIGVDSYQANERASQLAIVDSQGFNHSSEPTLFQVYPNPAGDQLNITFEENQKLNSIEILGTWGNLIQPATYIHAEKLRKFSIETSGMSDGVYHLKCNFSNGESQSQKFIVIH